MVEKLVLNKYTKQPAKHKYSRIRGRLGQKYNKDVCDAYLQKPVLSILLGQLSLKPSTK
jgi:hypothetical protein